MTPAFSRRKFLHLTECFAATSAIGSRFAFDADSPPGGTHGLVAGQMRAVQAGNKNLSEGGNAIDAAVAAALVAGVVSPNNCGIGGYGGHMVIALRSGRKITSIDFNSTAPSAAKPNMFQPDAKGAVPGRINECGYLLQRITAPAARVKW